MEFGLGVRENPGVYGCNNLSYSGTFSVVLTARGFFTRLGFSTYILCCDCFILSHLFFCLLTLLFAMSYGRILGTAIPRSSVYRDYPQQLVSEPYGLAMAVTSLYGRSYGGLGGIGIMMIMVA